MTDAEMDKLHAFSKLYGALFYLFQDVIVWAEDIIATQDDNDRLRELIRGIK